MARSVPGPQAKSEDRQVGSGITRRVAALRWDRVHRLCSYSASEMVTKKTEDVSACKTWSENDIGGIKAIAQAVGAGSSASQQSNW